MKIIERASLAVGNTTKRGLDALVAAGDIADAAKELVPPEVRKAVEDRAIFTGMLAAGVFSKGLGIVFDPKETFKGAKEIAGNTAEWTSDFAQDVLGLRVPDFGITNTATEITEEVKPGAIGNIRDLAATVRNTLSGQIDYSLNFSESDSGGNDWTT